MIACSNFSLRLLVLQVTKHDALGFVTIVPAGIVAMSLSASDHKYVAVLVILLLLLLLLLPLFFLSQRFS